MSTKALLTNRNSPWGIIVNPTSDNVYKHIVNFSNQSLKKEFINNELFSGQDFEILLDESPEIALVKNSELLANFRIDVDDYDNTVDELLNKDYCVIREDDQVDKFYAISAVARLNLNILEYSLELDVFFTYDILNNLQNDVQVDRSHFRRQINDVFVDDLNSPNFNHNYEKTDTTILNEEELLKNDLTDQDNSFSENGSSPWNNINVSPKRSLWMYVLQLPQEAEEGLKCKFYNTTDRNSPNLNVSPYKILVAPVTPIVIRQPDNADFEWSSAEMLKKHTDSEFTRLIVYSQQAPILFTNYAENDIQSWELIDGENGYYRVNTNKNITELTDLWNIKLGDINFTVNQAGRFAIQTPILNYTESGRTLNPEYYEDNAVSAVFTDKYNIFRYNQFTINFDDYGFIYSSLLNNKNLLNEIAVLNKNLFDLRIGFQNEEYKVLPPYLIPKGVLNLQLDGYIDVQFRETIRILDYNNSQPKKFSYDNTNNIPFSNDSYQEWLAVNKSVVKLQNITTALNPKNLVPSKGVESFFTLTTSRRVQDNKPDEVVDNGLNALSQLNIDFTKGKLFILTTKAIGNIFEQEGNLIYKKGVSINNLINSDQGNLLNYDTERSVFNYFECSEIFNNIILQVSSNVKQLINNSFETGLTFWHYRSVETWNDILDFSTDNKEID